MKNKKYNLRKDFDQIISLKKFLSVYCGIENEYLYKQKISHQDIKELLPEIKRCSFEYVYKHKNEVMIGTIILVEDCFNCIIPYFSPLEIKMGQPNVSVEENKVSKKQMIIEEAISMENLSRYELSELCKYYKRTKNAAKYRAAHKLLKEKKETSKEYRKQKYKTKKEGSNIYD